MERAQFIEQQTRAADRKLALSSGEEDARQRYLQLAIDTYDFLISADAAFVLVFDPWPKSAANALRSRGWRKRSDGTGIALPAPLIQRWEAWNREYFEVRSRNPKLELRDMMQGISESHLATGWPDGYERHIQAWVDAGDPMAPPPFDDRYGIVTAAFFGRLRQLRERCGGWLYWSDAAQRVVFAPEPEWQQVRAEQEAAEARRRGEWQEGKAKAERYGRRLLEVMATARSDAVFWEALRRWELAREAKRPPAPQPPSQPQQLPPQQMGWTTYGPLSSEERGRIDNPPVDPIFVDFIARAREADDVLTVLAIVLCLRSEMRRELGLDNMLGWSGGPGIGVA
jgi:hypothetical protein